MKFFSFLIICVSICIALFILGLSLGMDSIKKSAIENRVAYYNKTNAVFTWRSDREFQTNNIKYNIQNCVFYVATDTNGNPADLEQYIDNENFTTNH